MLGFETGERILCALEDVLERFIDAVDILGVGDGDNTQHIAACAANAVATAVGGVQRHVGQQHGGAVDAELLGKAPTSRASLISC